MKTTAFHNYLSFLHYVRREFYFVSDENLNVKNDFMKLIFEIDTTNENEHYIVSILLNLEDFLNHGKIITIDCSNMILSMTNNIRNNNIDDVDNFNRDNHNCFILCMSHVDCMNRIGKMMKSKKMENVFQRILLLNFGDKIKIIKNNISQQIYIFLKSDIFVNNGKGIIVSFGTKTVKFKDTTDEIIDTNFENEDDCFDKIKTFMETI